MPNISRFFPRRLLHLALALALALPLWAPRTAHADIESDIKEPVRLLMDKRFVKAVAALEEIAPRHQKEFALFYLLALANLGRATEDVDAIKYLQVSHASSLRARDLARNDKEKESARRLQQIAREALHEIGGPLEPPEASKDNPK